MPYFSKWTLNWWFICTMMWIGSFCSFLFTFSSCTFRKCQVTYTVADLEQFFPWLFLTFPICKLMKPSFSDIDTLWLHNDKYLKPLQLHFINPSSVMVNLTEEKILLWEALFWYHTSQQQTTCWKLASEVQE